MIIVYPSCEIYFLIIIAQLVEMSREKSKNKHRVFLGFVHTLKTHGVCLLEKA